jgi:hypothetical protein
MRRNALRVSLFAAALLIMTGGAVLAGSAFVPQFREPAGVAQCAPDQCGADYHVVARAEDLSDGRVLAFNVVVAEGVVNARIVTIAKDLRRRYPEARVIVYFFDEASASLHFGFGLVPTRDAQSVPEPTDRNGWIATLDHARDGHLREIWNRL